MKSLVVPLVILVTQLMACTPIPKSNVWEATAVVADKTIEATEHTVEATASRLDAPVAINSIEPLTPSATGTPIPATPTDTCTPTPTPLPPTATRTSTPTLVRPTATRTPIPVPTSTPVSQIAPLVGYFAPDFELKAIGGPSVRLGDLRGRPVLVNFWATWCNFCRAEMPDIQAAFISHQTEGFVVLGITKESHQEVAPAANGLGVTFPMLLDRDGKVTSSYKVMVYPSSFFVGRDGVIRAVKLGSVTKGELEAKLRTILPK